MMMLVFKHVLFKKGKGNLQQLTEQIQTDIDSDASLQPAPRTIEADELQDAAHQSLKMG